VLRDVPAEFATTSFGPTARRPVDIVAHMGDLMASGATLAQGQLVWKPEGGEDWETEVQRFFDGLGAIDRALAAEGGFSGSLAQLIQDRSPMPSPTSASSRCCGAWPALRCFPRATRGRRSNPVVSASTSRPRSASSTATPAAAALERSLSKDRRIRGVSRFGWSHALPCA
jgi:hypothetical protein